MNIDTLWQQYQSRLLGFLLRQTADRTLAEDILQQVFVKLLQTSPTSEHPAQLEAWLLRVCKTTLIDHYRRNKQTFLSLDDVAEGDVIADDEPAEPNPAITNCLQNAITVLPKAHADAIRAADLNDVPHATLAKQLNVQPATIRSWVYRGRQKLKQQLAPCLNDCPCEDTTPPEQCCATQPSRD